jgi:hypothetical protein
VVLPLCTSLWSDPLEKLLLQDEEATSPSIEPKSRRHGDGEEDQRR